MRKLMSHIGVLLVKSWVEVDGDGGVISHHIKAFKLHPLYKMSDEGMWVQHTWGIQYHQLKLVC